MEYLTEKRLWGWCRASPLPSALGLSWRRVHAVPDRVGAAAATPDTLDEAIASYIMAIMPEAALARRDGSRVPWTFTIHGRSKV